MIKKHLVKSSLITLLGYDSNSFMRGSCLSVVAMDLVTEIFMLLMFQLIQTNKLKHYPSIHGDFSSDFRQPCVVFTGHPSLRFGDVVHFMELWGKSSLNTVIFTGN